jgi:hypothetical protein
MFQNLGRLVRRSAHALPIVLMAQAGQAQDFVLVADYAGSRVIRFAYPSGTALDHFVGTNLISSLANCGNMVFGADGDLYIASQGTSAVVRVDGVTGYPVNGGNFVASAAGGLSRAVSVAFGPDGELYVSSYNNNSIFRYDHVNGNFLNAFVAAGAGGLDGPYGIRFHNGDLYVCSYLNNKVIHYNGTTGAYIEDAVPAAQSGLTNPRDVIFDSAGRMYVTSGNNSVIVKDPATGFSILTSLSTNNQINNPQFMNFTPAPAEQLLVSCYGSGTVQKVDRQTGASLGTLILNAAGGLSSNICPLYVVGTTPCYANCDNSTVPPILNVNDFQCFLNKFAVGCT